MSKKSKFSEIFEKRDLAICGGILVLILAASFVQSSIYTHVDKGQCSLDNWAQDIFHAAETHTKLKHSRCYGAHFKDMSIEETLKYQRQYEELLAAKYPRMGYKIANHEPREQKLFNLEGPVFGVFYGEDSFRENGSIVDVQGEDINFEPDFLLRVGDERINQATTIEEAAKYIDRFYAFIELPAYRTDRDQIRGGGPFPNFQTLQAANCIARWGVVGDHIELKDDPNIIENLQKMVVVPANKNGRNAAPYDVVNDDTHPLITAIHTANFLKDRGEKLKVGDLISGGMMKNFIGAGVKFGMPGQDNDMRHVNYFIGDKMLHVSVGFTDSGNKGLGASNE